ncbi:MAG: 4-(cytidine 5'-diphospho)-2-C-methyl-D-erythritol kinase [Lachnospiraceae bacterium]|nr:4-(cytidine 5'-diphospho)-2-C-methyl-D-erythritol kinase [Lachnospiraceae bacterium]
MQTITRKAYAKINLALDVVRRLDNGYHEVRMIMQTVGLYDELTFQKTDGGIVLTVDMTSSSRDAARTREGARLPLQTDSPNGAVPADQSNLIYKAAKLLLDSSGVTDGVSIHLRKNIPVAAGMAGGSTDAAATLLGLNALFGLHYTKEELRALGVKIGADVPYCIQGGTALAEGIGEILSPLPAPPAAHLVIAKPDIDVSTAFVYRNLHLETVMLHPDIDGMIAALDRQDLKGIADRLGNVLETVTVPAYPVIAQIKEKMVSHGAQGALMSGSGPTVFGIFEHSEEAQSAAEDIRTQGLAGQVFVTGFEP